MKTNRNSSAGTKADSSTTDEITSVSQTIAKPNVGCQGLSGMLVIGDVHGKVDNYWKILQKHKGTSIQVGDFGFKKQHDWHLANIDYSQHQINFGNHDDYSYLYEPHSLSNWSYAYEAKLMTIRGAYSIDKAYRTEYLDWWANEELNYSEMQQAVDFYNFNKPKIIISHDCPHEVRKQLFGINDKSITSDGLQVMFENHQPDLWIFGHHHKSKNEVINGTRFVCLAELETFVI
jgi:predicted phosphodiesterase